MAEVSFKHVKKVYPNTESKKDRKKLRLRTILKIHPPIKTRLKKAR